MDAFIRAGTSLIPAHQIRSIDCSKLESELVLWVETGERRHKVVGIEAVDLVMRVYPFYFEGKRFRWVRHAWAIHNLVGHPGLQVLAWLGMPKLGMRLHDVTVPRPKAPVP